MFFSVRASAIKRIVFKRTSNLRVISYIDSGYGVTCEMTVIFPLHGGFLNHLACLNPKSTLTDTRNRFCLFILVVVVIATGF